jgi:SAM-dependent methyltransferase
MPAPGLRDVNNHPIGVRGAEALRDLNARHPWDHNAHFHAWITSRLPQRHKRALDVGCGRGALLETLAQLFDQVTGIDVDRDMRKAADARCALLENVEVTGTPLAQLAAQQRGSVDLVTMIAVLHHLDLEEGLAQVRDLLAPGGKLLVVGLARPDTVRDQLWDAASIVTNPLIGMVTHPWPALPGQEGPSIPVKDPTMSFDEVRERGSRILPGLQMHHHLAFRYTLEWEKPGG